MARGTVNKVILLGRLGQDPESRATASGTQVVTINLATNELGPKDAQGNRPQAAEWHRLVLFGKLAANALQYLLKGSQLYVEGRLRTRKWQDQNGMDRYATEIVVNEMQFIGGRPENGARQAPATAPSSQGPASTTAQPAGNNFDDFDDDIPF